MLDEDNQLEEVEKILDRELGAGSVCSYSLIWITDKEHEVKLVPVEIVNITEDCKQDKFCRLFQVPDDCELLNLIKR